MTSAGPSVSRGVIRGLGAIPRENKAVIALMEASWRTIYCIQYAISATGSRVLKVTSWPTRRPYFRTKPVFLSIRQFGRALPEACIVNEERIDSIVADIHKDSAVIGGCRRRLLRVQKRLAGGADGQPGLTAQIEGDAIEWRVGCGHLAAIQDLVGPGLRPARSAW
jgi:hypothetical protein